MEDTDPDEGVEWFFWYLNKIEHESVQQPERAGQLYRCPCCRCKTLDKRGGFDICPVCFWEDDGQDNADADTVRGGPNGALSLTTARENYARFGACELRFKANVRMPRPEELDQG